MTPSVSSSSGRSTKSAGRSTSTKSRAPKLSSRAVLREVEPGSTVECVHCGERVKFQAKMRHKQVICNVYVGRRWDRVEHFHASCYAEADAPHGEVDTTPPVRRRSSATNNATGNAASSDKSAATRSKAS